MRAKVRDTEIYFDVDGAGRVPEGATMRQRPVALVTAAPAPTTPASSRRSLRSPRTCSSSTSTTAATAAPRAAIP